MVTARLNIDTLGVGAHSPAVERVLEQFIDDILEKPRYCHTGTLATLLKSGLWLYFPVV